LYEVVEAAGFLKLKGILTSSIIGNFSGHSGHNSDIWIKQMNIVGSFDIVGSPPQRFDQNSFSDWEPQSQNDVAFHIRVLPDVRMLPESQSAGL
jgi:hypothetical protein